MSGDRQRLAQGILINGLISTTRNRALIIERCLPLSFFVLHVKRGGIIVEETLHAHAANVFS